MAKLSRKNARVVKRGLTPVLEDDEEYGLTQQYEEARAVADWGWAPSSPRNAAGPAKQPIKRRSWPELPACEDAEKKLGDVHIEGTRTLMYLQWALAPIVHTRQELGFNPEDDPVQLACDALLECVQQDIEHWNEEFDAALSMTRAERWALEEKAERHEAMNGME